MAAGCALRIFSIPFALAATVGSAWADIRPDRPPSGAEWLEKADFDLAPDYSDEKAHRVSDAVGPLDEEAQTLRWQEARPNVRARERVRARLVYQPILSGPLIEVGALGSGRKHMPRLMHVGVAWDF